MITITEKENQLLEAIKKFNDQYDNGVPMKTLQEELNIYEHNLHDILSDLTKKKLINYSYSTKIIKLKNITEEINIVETKEDILNLELNKRELNVLQVIRDAVNDENRVSRYILEGKLLYGKDKISNFQMYHILLSLELKGIIKKIKSRDGEYYKLIQ